MYFLNLPATHYDWLCIFTLWIELNWIVSFHRNSNAALNSSPKHKPLVQEDSPIRSKEAYYGGAHHHMLKPKAHLSTDKEEVKFEPSEKAPTSFSIHDSNWSVAPVVCMRTDLWYHVIINTIVNYTMFFVRYCLYWAVFTVQRFSFVRLFPCWTKYGSY